MKINLSIEEALALIEEKCNRIIRTETRDISKCLNYILSESIFSLMDNPPFSKSAMDGYALNLKENKSDLLDIQGVIYAGDSCFEKIKKNGTFKIMTGAKIPLNCDTVIQKELCREIEGKLKIEGEIKIGQNICYKGEEIKKGELLFEKNEKLTAPKLAVLAGVGYSKILVYKKPRIALIACGNEICSLDEEISEGKIYDVNTILFSQRLKEFGYDVERIEILPDDVSCVCEKLIKCSKEYDLIITTGGVSVGDKDIFHEVFEKVKADRIFWKVNLKPGTPMMFSVLNNCPIVSLSGNPFAASVTFEIFVRHVLYLLTSDESFKIKKKVAILENDFKKVTKKTRFVKGILIENQVFIPEGMHSSYSLKEMKNCNCLIEIPISNEMKRGCKVKVWKI